MIKPNFLYIFLKTRVGFHNEKIIYLAFIWYHYCIFGANLVKIGSVVRMVELPKDIQTFF